MQQFIIRRGEALCGVTICDGAPETAAFAAGELIRCLTMQAGIEPELGRGAPKPGNIALGAHSEGLETEELRIRVLDGALCVD